MALSAAELAFARQGALHDCRTDGRQRLEVRPVTVARGTLAYANGSATASIGHTGAAGSRSGETTVVTAAVSCDVAEATGPLVDGEPRLGDVRFNVDVEQFGAPAAANVVEGGATAGPSNFHRREIEQSLVRALVGAYGVPEADDASPEEVAARYTPLSGAKTTPAALLQRARDAKPAGIDRSSLYISHGHAFVLVIDVQVRASAAGNVLGAALAAIRCAVADTLLPTPTVTVNDGIAAVHLNNKQRTRRVDASACPLAVSVAIDPSAGVYVADPTPCEERAFPFVGHMAIATDGNTENDSSRHHRIVWASVAGARRPEASAEGLDSIRRASGVGAGMSSAELAALLGEASGALFNSVAHSVRDSDAGEDDKTTD